MTRATIRTATLLTLLLCGAATRAEEEVASPGTEAMVDEGLFLIDGARGLGRTEDFVVFRRPDGGYTVINSVVGKDFTSAASFNYDSAWRLINAKGQGTAKGVTRTVDIKRDKDERGPIVRITRRLGKRLLGKGDYYTAPCDRDCLIDLAPSVVPASVMPSRYDIAKAGEQSFRWVRASLISDDGFLEGSTTLTLKSEQKIEGAKFDAVIHWAMSEDFKDPSSEKRETLQGRAWTDPKGWLRKFTVGTGPRPSMTGIRASDEKLSKQMIAE